MSPDTRRALYDVISAILSFALVVGLAAVIVLAVGELGADAGWWR